ncbi:heavy metal-binding domain-containing protein [Mucilaginibacter kameinonensis]|uniref:heavy metal-binding domain-containing protein n=1 Tax=Mucilaginibacter kameinonensis TaxID=452286 RepID=UPI000EF7621F|nr:heavy metal-binding domain-containing protein [Mucilaginibacter kameinonensis]
MKKTMLMAVAALFSVSSAFTADNGKMLPDTTKTNKAKPAKVQYTCTMHPEVLLDKPGKCPKCGMPLVKKESAKKKADSTKMKM